MSEKKSNPIYVGYLGPTNGYTFFSQTTLTGRTIINDTWEKMTAPEDIEKFRDMDSDQFVISSGRFGNPPSEKPSKYLSKNSAEPKEPKANPDEEEKPNPEETGKKGKKGAK